MKKAIKYVFVAALTVLMLVSLVACDNGGSTADATPTPTPSQDGPTVGGNFTKPGEVYSFYSWQYTSDNPYSGDDERSQQMRQRVEGIQDKYGITIEFITSSSGALESAYQGLPEITGMKEGGLHTMMSTYLYNNLPGACLTPLSDHKDVYDLDNENKFNVYSQYDLCEYNDKLWYFIPIEIGIHFECGGNCMVFNKKLVEAAGFKADDIYAMVENKTWTWDKFEEILQAVNDPTNGVIAIERAESALFMWSLANANGTEFVRLETLENGQKQDTFVYYGDKGDRLMAAYDEFIKLANTLKVMDTKYYGGTDTAPLNHFKHQQSVFFFNGYSSNPLKDIATAEFEYGLVPWPIGPDNAKSENEYHSFYPHLNPYCVFRDVNGNVKGAVQILCELYTPIYDANSEEAQLLYTSEKTLFCDGDEKAMANLDLVEAKKEHFRVFMYSNAPTTLSSAKTVGEALFGKGEDAILAQETSAAQYFSSIAGAINNAIMQRSPYSWK